MSRVFNATKTRMINNGQSSSLYQQQIRTLLANKQGK